MRISINCPSYQRAGAVGVLSYLPGARLFVCESEAAAYREKHPDATLVVMPAGVQGNIARVRNWMLEHEFDRGIDAVCMVDDDLRYVGRFRRRKRVRVPPAEIEAWVYKYSRVALESGAKLWGINVNNDNQAYREFSPFSFVSVVLGPFMVHLKNGIRYDERFFLKEDYDISIQHLNAYRRVLRLNAFFYMAGMGGSGTGQAGGISGIRNVEREFDQIELLQKKWGRLIVRMDKNVRNHFSKKKKLFDINPVVRVPIRGI